MNRNEVSVYLETDNRDHPAWFHQLLADRLEIESDRHDGVSGMLFARGVGVRKKRLDELPATAVAPLVAQLLGISLDQ